MDYFISPSFPDFLTDDLVGAEVRKVIHDGWPISQTIATDLEAGVVSVCNNYAD